MITTQEIDGRLAAMDRALAGLRTEAETLALGALGGDDVAKVRLTEINRAMAEQEIERRTLADARAAAARIEEAAAQDERKRIAAEHLAEAGVIAAEIIDTAVHVEALADAYEGMIEALNALERKIIVELQLAGQLHTIGGTFGQTDLAGWAKDEINGVLVAPVFRPSPRIAARMRAAWGHLVRKKGRV